MRQRSAFARFSQTAVADSLNHLNPNLHNLEFLDVVGIAGSGDPDFHFINPTLFQALFNNDSAGFLVDGYLFAALDFLIGKLALRLGDGKRLLRLDPGLLGSFGLQRHLLRLFAIRIVRFLLKR